MREFFTMYLNNNADKKWYVVYTRPRWEKKAATYHAAAGIECYCPLNKVSKQWTDRKKVVLEPLFKSYLFVKVDKDKMWQVTAIPGVLNYVYWLGKPATVPEREIEAIRLFLADHQQVFIEQKHIKPGDTIRINSAPFYDIEGRVIAIKGNRVQVQIPSLNIALFAFEYENID